eukprot:TRINITY_DN7218_c1_g1_i1.p1 TRINITY_DN7218_c1_g1~~TRINITY_DN7218_c1_g1_i1.p1  ORF type:complete len:149 (-),score=9.98 TRINITY_DN7218_c1_g1_i1:388-834(-)
MSLVSRGTNAIYRHTKYLKGLPLLTLLESLPNQGIGAKVKKTIWISDRYNHIVQLKRFRKTGKIKQAFAIHYNKGVPETGEVFMVTSTKRLIWRLLDRPVSAQLGETTESEWRQQVLDGIKRDEQQRIKLMTSISESDPEEEIVTLEE